MALQSLDAPFEGRPSPGAAIRRRAGITARGFASRYGLLIGFVLLWQISAMQGWLNPAVFPPLDVIGAALWKGLASGALLDDIAISLQRAGTAFGAAVAIGIPLGLVMGQIAAVERALDPILQLFRQTSALALFPILLATIGGVKQVDRKLIEMARTFGASRLTVFRRVVLPASVPAIFVGLRLSATTALLLLIAAEMIGANKGVGFQVMNAQYNFQIPLMFAAIFLLAGLGLAANLVLVVLQRRLCRWAEPQR